VKSHDNEHLMPGGAKSVGGHRSDTQPDAEDGVEQCDVRHKRRQAGRTVTPGLSPSLSRSM
jgi:hypothetical protein